jgi:hypothetical protein
VAVGQAQLLVYGCGGIASPGSPPRFRRRLGRAGTVARHTLIGKPTPAGHACLIWLWRCIFRP